MENEVMVCNIKRQGVVRRYQSAAVFFTAAILATVYVNLYQSADSMLRYILFPMFQVASVTFAQAPARTCVANAFLGVTEDEKFKKQAIKSKEIVLAHRVRALAVICVASTVGTVLAALALASSHLHIECKNGPTTCSVLYIA